MRILRCVLDAGVRDMQRKRFKNVEVVQEISDVDEEWRATGFKADMYNKAKNVISKVIGAKMKVRMVCRIGQLTNYLVCL